MAWFPVVIFCMNICNVLLEVATCAVYTPTFRTHRLLLLMAIAQWWTTVFWHRPWKSRPCVSVRTSTILIIAKSKMIRHYHYKQTFYLKSLLLLTIILLSNSLSLITSKLRSMTKMRIHSFNITNSQLFPTRGINLR